ncbi:tRNA/rRNA methyltransferase [Virgisporangium aliadipatigenens]|uniref:tRNA/rRNA methyltransferase n=1 Tax=Virgisporangium aliadipatigenens TaxID=741659 RepID=A0A8J3YWL4_9ACTN|nr:tRNA/rRNA methyltransferase [Virgisporangium aliadipatigenens]
MVFVEPQLDLQQIGLSHPRVKQVLDIQRNTAPNRHKLFVAEGLWAHNLLLETGAPVECFFWCPEAIYSDEARKRSSEIAARAYRAYRVSPKTMERICERERPDGMVSIAQLPAWDRDELSFGDSALVLVADAVEIPGNLGTLLRSMDAAGADCLVMTNRRTRLTHPKVFKGSQGMCLTMPSVEFDEVEDAAIWLKRNGFSVYLADTDDARNYREVDYRGRVAFVVGSERYGISKAWYAHGFGRVFVPMLGRADSLNVSVSASVLLYEARAQQDRW